MMTLTFRWLAFPLVLAALLFTPAAQATGAPPEPRSVLWIGNSFTFYNGGIPAMVAALAADLQPMGASARLETGMLAVGGAHLPDHAERSDPNLYSGWDLIVLQGYSDEPVNPAKSAAFEQALEVLARRVRDSGAGLALFMTWAYKDRPAMTTRLATAYEAAARRTGALVVPAGLAFARAKAARPSLPLQVAEDNKHPSLAGSYLAACVFYAQLFGRSPEGTQFAPSGLTPGDAVFLQRIAWETVQAYPGGG